MSTPCSQSLRPNRCVVSEHEVSNFLGSQEWDIFRVGHFSGTPCSTVDVVLTCIVNVSRSQLQQEILTITYCC